MLVLIMSIVLFVALLRINSAVTSHKEDFISNGVSEKEFTTFRISVWIYLVALVLINAPVKQLIILVFPIPFILLVLLPGILKSKKLSATLEISGTDRGASAGEVANRAMWLGIAVGLIIICSWGWIVIVGSLVHTL